ncbi:hypothetical protein SDC9_165858 [bioreactor metagenome]|uniref:Uncharacterized protein n=1 Tax=bioreactor metagenome TaxID=1076179 RepID=A0A645FVF9_9ZZZZ
MVATIQLPSAPNAFSKSLALSLTDAPETTSVVEAVLEEDAAVPLSESEPQAVKNIPAAAKVTTVVANFVCFMMLPPIVVS